MEKICNCFHFELQNRECASAKMMRDCLNSEKLMSGEIKKSTLERVRSVLSSCKYNLGFTPQEDTSSEQTL
jgi:hypothetical protein